MRNARWLLGGCLLGIVACANLLGIEDARLVDVDAGPDAPDANPRVDGPCVAGGCVAERVLASAELDGRILIDGADLVWSVKTESRQVDIHACKLPACAAPSRVIDAEIYAVANGEVYCARSNGDPIEARPLDGGVPRMVSRTGAVTIFEVDGTELLFGTLERKDGGIDSIERVVTTPTTGPESLRDLYELPQSELVFYAQHTPEVTLIAAPSGLRICPTTGCTASSNGTVLPLTPSFSFRERSLVGTANDGSLVACEVPGCQLRTIATTPDAAKVVHDGPNVYWITTRGSIRRAPLSGSDPAGITLHEGDDPSSVRGIALDATHVYWTAADGIYRLALP